MPAPRCRTRPSSSSLRQDELGALLGLVLSVSITSSGLVGASYGSATPVNSLISPANAFAYRPLTSRRAHSSTDASTCTSTNGPNSSTSSRAFCARLLVGRDRRRDHGAAVARQPRGDPADALDVRVAVLLREAEALREVRAHGVAVEVLDERGRGARARGRRCGRSSSCPAPESPVNQSVKPPSRLRSDSGMLVQRGCSRSFVPFGVDVDAALELVEPAQRPARSSSSGSIGRVHGMQPIDRYPASCSGL